MDMMPYLGDRREIADANELIARFGELAGSEAAARAVRSRDLGNHIHFCRWRQIERLIALMMRSSPEFREWWPQRDVVHRLSGLKHLRHPIAGAMTFEHMSLSIDDGSDMRLIVYTPLAEQNSVAKLRKLLEGLPTERRSA